MLNAAQAKGYAGIMLTGVNARDPLVKSALGLAQKDEIIAFLYLGTPAEAPRAKRRPDPADFTREWTAPLGDARPEAAESRSPTPPPRRTVAARVARAALQRSTFSPPPPAQDKSETRHGG